jgi:hypothetical protein
VTRVFQSLAPPFRSTFSRNGSPAGSSNGKTGINGTATFTIKNAQAGTYTTTVTDVTAPGLTWEVLRHRTVLPNDKQGMIDGLYTMAVMHLPRSRLNS